MEREHALLSASSSNRWLVCTPSARLEDSEPDKTSKFAEEGEQAHELADIKLKNRIGEISSLEYAKKLEEIKDKSFYNMEMDEYTDGYVKYILEKARELKGSTILSERKVNYGNIAPEGFGTSDCIIYNEDKLIIIDFKYGKGVLVSAINNTQMKLYALGALNEIDCKPSEIEMIIYQPRKDNISISNASIQMLTKWGNDIKPIAEMAYKGEGEFKKGNHCRFCRAKAKCGIKNTKSDISISKTEKDAYTTIGDVRLNLVSLFTPNQYGGYSITMMIPKRSRAIREVKKLMKAAIIKGKKEMFDDGDIQLPLYNGKGNRPNGEKFDEVNKDYWILTARSKTPVDIVDRDMRHITDGTELYSGVWAKVAIALTPYKYNGNGISCKLGGVQKMKDDDVIIETPRAEELFKKE